MEISRRTLLAGIAGGAGTATLAGCLGNDSAGSDSGGDGPTVESSFFVFGDIASHVAGDTATDKLLVPVGQHGHGFSPGVRVREDIRAADLLVHGMKGFQPWIDSIRTDLDADGADVETIDVSRGIDLLKAGGHDHSEADGEHEGEHDEEKHEGDEETGHREGMDPHFWMDPMRVTEAASNVRQGLVDADPDNADTYTENAEQFQAALAELHEELEATVEAASNDVLLVAGHNSHQYLGEQYGIQIEALTNVSPDDRPTQRDIAAAQEIIETHDLQYLCVDPLEPQQAADQLVAETDAEAALPLTAMPGLTDEWSDKEWGYLDIMENVNLPTLEDALNA